MALSRSVCCTRGATVSGSVTFRAIDNTVSVVSGPRPYAGARRGRAV